MQIHYVTRISAVFLFLAWSGAVQLSFAGVVSKITTGLGHSVALMSDGTVRAWGSNNYGQLGNGKTSYGYKASAVIGLQGEVIAIAAGVSHTVALMSGGGIMVWGDGRMGQLGNGMNEVSYVPVRVTGLNGKAIAIAAGDAFTVALMEDGTAMSWGENSLGQLGIMSRKDSNIPLAVEGLEGPVSALAASGLSTAALMSDGTVYMWGCRPAVGCSSKPAQITGLGDSVKAISAGAEHMVAILSDGSIKAWGTNKDGQLGDGTKKDSKVPVKVVNLDGGVTSISAGYSHTLALMQDGSVKAWGKNESGRLGNGTTDNSAVPLSVVGLQGDVSTIAAGQSWSLALMTDGSVKAWGDNGFAQLGNNHKVSRSLVPIDVTGLSE